MTRVLRVEEEGKNGGRVRRRKKGRENEAIGKFCLLVRRAPKSQLALTSQSDFLDTQGLRSDSTVVDSTFVSQVISCF